MVHLVLLDQWTVQAKDPSEKGTLGAKLVQPSLLSCCVSFIFLTLDLLWSTTGKYKDQNEQNKSAE